MSCPFRATHALAGAPLLTHGHRDTRPPPPRAPWCSRRRSEQDPGTVELSPTRDVRPEVTGTGGLSATPNLHSPRLVPTSPPPYPPTKGQGDCGREPQGDWASGPSGAGRVVQFVQRLSSKLEALGSNPVFPKKRTKVVNSFIILKYIVHSWSFPIFFL
jgi:hypothetical protein